jgi:hypothetical protein
MKEKSILGSNWSTRKLTCGGASERLAWFPLRSVDLERLVSPSAVIFRLCHGASGVCPGVRGLLMLLSFPSAGRGDEGVEEDGTTVFLVRVIYGLFLRYGCHGVKLLLAGHGGEGRMRLDVTSVVGTYCSGIWDWRYCLVFPISCLPDVLEKDLIALTPQGGHSCGVQNPL